VNAIPREDRHAQRRNILRQIIRQTDDPKEQERLYEEQTGCKRADFFRRKGEIKGGEFDEQDAA
jgi:hypothetical protein